MHFLRAPLGSLELCPFWGCRGKDVEESSAGVTLHYYYKEKALLGTVLNQPLPRYNLESVIQSLGRMHGGGSSRGKAFQVLRPVPTRVLMILACVSFTIPARAPTSFLVTLLQKHSLVSTPLLSRGTSSFSSTLLRTPLWKLPRTIPVLKRS